MTTAFYLLLKQMDEEHLFYSSHSKLSFFKNGQDKLRNQKVLVIGAGGLGCPCLLSLAGAGIGALGIADFDTVSLSNLHRQNIYQFTDVGKPKITAAAEKLSQYNPFITIQPHPILVDETNILALLEHYDLIVDCTDNFASRYLINDACIFLNKTLVYGAIHQAEGHVTVFNYHGSATLRCLFPNNENEAVNSCAVIGAYNIATGIIGLMMANEVIKITLEQHEVFANKLVQLDTLTGKTVTIKYELLPENLSISQQRFTADHNSQTIGPPALKNKIAAKQNFRLVDVREPGEHAIENIGGANIPLQQLLEQINFECTTSDEIIVYCQTGSRSMQAAALLLSKGFVNVKSLQGGLNYYRQFTW